MPVYNLDDGGLTVGRARDEATILRAGYAYEQAADWHLRRPLDLALDTCRGSALGYRLPRLISSSNWRPLQAERCYSVRGAATES
ncbi:MAG: hypothetical protein ACR2PL_22055 [Dehalococcoidia bacterium]